jgi:hypothetical protein
MEFSEKKEHFRRWVFWTGIFNIVAYAALLCPFTMKIFFGTSTGLSNALGLGGKVFSMPENVNHVIMITILGLIVVFLGIFLIIASLDIQKRAWFVFWNGVTRILVFLFFLYYVLFSSAAQILLLFGVIDLVIGIIYIYYIFTIKELMIT